MCGFLKKKKSGKRKFESCLKIGINSVVDTYWKCNFKLIYISNDSALIPEKAPQTRSFFYVKSKTNKKSEPVSYLENLVRIFLVWCRWPGSNRYGVATTGFWVRHVCQFHHTGGYSERKYYTRYHSENQDNFPRRRFISTLCP